MTLLQGISRGDRMDYTIQKAVELGVNRIIPLLTQRFSGKPDPRRLEKKILHWQAIANSACEQSGRVNTVEITEPVRFDEIKQFHAELKLLPVPGSRQYLSDFSSLQPETLNLLIGPEGGLDQNEINNAILHDGYQAISLGPRILRTETAGVVALSIAQSLWGDLRQV